MSRKKPKVVDTVKHTDSGISVDILLEPDDLTFRAKLPDDTWITHSEAAALRREVNQWLNANLVLEWHSAIAVKVLSPFSMTERTGDFVGFTIDRFHWAKKLTGHNHYVKTRWLHRPDDEDNRGWGERGKKCGWTFVQEFWTSQREFNPPCRLEKDFDRGVYYIPYSEEIWLGLEKMLEGIREINERLNDMLADPEQGHAYLAQVGASILKALPEKVIEDK